MSIFVTCVVPDASHVLLSGGTTVTLLFQSSGDGTSVVPDRQDVTVTALPALFDSHGATAVAVTCTLSATSPTLQWLPSVVTMHVWKRSVAYPWLSDIVTVSSTGAVVSGIANGVLSLTVSSGTDLCVVAVTSETDGESSFVHPVGVYFGDDLLPLSVDVSNATHVCGSPPSLAALCRNDTECIFRGVTVNITVVNGDSNSLPFSTRSSAAAAVSATSDEMGWLTCPPDCPASGGGITFAEYCNDVVPDPAVCLNPTTASQCWLGTPPDCSPCPGGAICTSLTTWR